MNSRISYLMWWVSLCSIHFSKIQAQSQCPRNSLKACACNFINACKWDPITETFNAFGGAEEDLKSFIPDLMHLAQYPTHVAKVCEPGSFGIIYDCTNRIPIAATIVMTADQYKTRKYRRPRVTFKWSSKIGRNFQQNKVDYKSSSKRVPCIETTNGNYTVEHSWYLALTGKSFADYTYPCPTRPPKSSIHRGHLIASSYGRGTPARSAETYVYTNTVPQFGKLNSGSWRSFEGKLIKWARTNCGKAPLHVIVGTVPSTYGADLAKPRFFGQAGFSNYSGGSLKFPLKQPYWVNVPEFLWTAACCHSSSASHTKSTAFYAPNKPGRRLVKNVKLSRLFAAVGATHVDLFPGMPKCTDDANYIPV